MAEYVKVKITDLMNKAYKLCGEDSRCDGCPAELGEDDCIFNYEYSTLDEWIPVSERLPKTHEESQDILDRYTLGVIDTDRHDVSDLVLVTVIDRITYKKIVHTDCLVDGKWCEYDNEMFKITAWQPLPEPYKGE